MLAGFLLVFSASQANSVEKSEILDIMKNDLAGCLYSMYEDFQITEIFSKNDDKKTFL
jgi:hypothetical protein